MKPIRKYSLLPTLSRRSESHKNSDYKEDDQVFLRTKQLRSLEKKRLLLKSYLVPFEKTLKVQSKLDPINLTMLNQRSKSPKLLHNPQTKVNQTIKGYSSLTKQKITEIKNSMNVKIQPKKRFPKIKIEKKDNIYMMIFKGEIRAQIKQQTNNPRMAISINGLINYEVPQDPLGMTQNKWAFNETNQFCLAYGNLESPKIWFPFFIKLYFNFKEEKPFISLTKDPIIFHNEKFFILYEFEDFISLQAIFKHKITVNEKFLDEEIAKIAYDLLICMKLLENQEYFYPKLMLSYIGYCFQDQKFKFQPRKKMYRIQNNQTIFESQTKQLGLLILKLKKQAIEIEDEETFITNQVFQLQSESSDLTTLILRLIEKRPQNQQNYEQLLQEFYILSQGFSLKKKVQSQQLSLEQKFKIVDFYKEVQEYEKGVEILIGLRNSQNLNNNQNTEVLKELWKLLIRLQDRTKLIGIAKEYLSYQSQRAGISIKNANAYAHDLFEYGRVLKVHNDLKNAHYFFSQSIIYFEKAFGKVSIEIAIVLNDIVEILQITKSSELSAYAELAVSIFVKLDSYRANFNRIEYWRALVRYGQVKMNNPSSAIVAFQNAIIQFDEAKKNGVDVPYQPLYYIHLMDYAQCLMKLNKNTNEVIQILNNAMEYQIRNKILASFDLFINLCTLLHNEQRKQETIKVISQYYQELKLSDQDEKEKIDLKIKIAALAQSFELKQVAFQIFSETLKQCQELGIQSQIQVLEKSLESCM